MNRITSHSAAAIAALTIAACGDASVDSVLAPGGIPAVEVLTASSAQTRPAPTGKGIGTLATTGIPRTRYRVEYQPWGRVMPGTSNVYFIWYGNWVNDPGVTILTDLATSLGGSSYFAIASMYTSATQPPPSGGLVYGGAVEDLYSKGATLSDDDIRDVVFAQLQNGGLPVDSRGIYVVLASPDIWASSGLDVTYCAFHARDVYMGSTMKYVFVGGPARAPSLCAPQQVSPNGNYNADAMASLLAAELFNSVTDPEMQAWYDRLGLEPGDKCAWNYGATYQTANGARANIRLGQRDYLLQQLWVPGKGGGVCAMAKPGA